jgi:hypothetical protein
METLATLMIGFVTTFALGFSLGAREAVLGAIAVVLTALVASRRLS